MQDKLFIDQLERYYPAYLKSIIADTPFQPIILRGGKARPETYKELEAAIIAFQSCEKANGKSGWNVTWEDWNSKKHGRQQWPSIIRVETEEDFLFLLKKEHEVARFKIGLQSLLRWRMELRDWLLLRPAKVLEFSDSWAGICAVVDYIISEDVSHHYLRSLPVPVHTKFIERFSGTILSLIRHFDNSRCVADSSDIEQALGLRKKPMIFPSRWLDVELQSKVLPGMEVIGLTTQTLLEVKWPLHEVWLVENETTLFMLPPRPNAIAICTRGYAVEQLSDIPLLKQCKLWYWGDMDEDGYRMLAIARQKYVHVQSVLMDEMDFLFHETAAGRQPAAYKSDTPEKLTNSESAAYLRLKQINGRIEQEQLQLEYVFKLLHNVA